MGKTMLLVHTPVVAGTGEVLAATFNHRVVHLVSDSVNTYRPVRFGCHPVLFAWYGMLRYMAEKK